MPARRLAKPSASSTERPAAGDGAGGASIDPTAASGSSAAAEQLARDHAALAAALDPIVTIDGRGIIQSASDSVHRVLGWMPGELIGRNVSLLMPEPHHSAHDGYLANYHATGQTNILNRPRRFDALRKDGSLVPIELCVSRAAIQGGGPPLFVGIIRDMSAYAAVERSRDDERLRSQQLLSEQTSALQQANLRLRMADRMASIGTLAAGLGHDMNNVLLPVRARLNALRSAAASGKLPATERGHIEEIRKSVAYLQQLADGLHFLAMDPDAEQDARVAAVNSGSSAATNLREWWSQVGALLSKAVPKHVRVSVSFPVGLPPAAIVAHGLTQAVLNLVVNAGEAIPGPSERKRRQGHVRVWAAAIDGPDGAWVRIGVTDNGTGMTEDVRRRAFEMFYTTKPRGLGTGLGLALVRGVVERAGGRVEIESEVNKGTTVVMIVPSARTVTRSATGTDGAIAVISVEDGRAAAILRHVLEALGRPLRIDNDPARAEIWIIDPRHVKLNDVRAWRRDHQQGRLVLFGKPDPDAAAVWQAIGCVTIENRDDLEAVRAGLRRATAAR